ncbi:MAG TPA: 4Fe-4S dicluster domain-containing protein [Leptospiraceae bacterium]|nr:4Fe-4S dicluster domain-containing protein [Leptospiraceae bacterium]HMW06474.1 4Fe-4S dicluster domain-containing protein [Leptospiraceae bacterium]HMX32424.1 4Fe-4S dicluster domain-containing protein [Leptospiraceae bacterium]HMY33667.1 4Fe-4S dicluster domain-containing protein [Leptospiraceae bacterium]HMZ65218.1 4Fe-4S dicluster domain-containing protein [Leptospiraceae bacterium]
MAHVVLENCLDCKYTNCAAVCPAEAFREGPDMLYIDPDSCIDCGACIPECPVEAILPDYEIPNRSSSYIQLNAEESKKYPLIINNKRPLKGDRCIENKK